MTKQYESDIKKLKSDRKNKRKRHPYDPTKIRKINNNYEKKIDYQAAIIKSLKKSIVQQTKKLDTISAKNNNEEDDSLVGSGSGSGSSSSSSAAATVTAAATATTTTAAIAIATTATIAKTVVSIRNHLHLKRDSQNMMAVVVKMMMNCLLLNNDNYVYSNHRDIIMENDVE